MKGNPRGTWMAAKRNFYNLSKRSLFANPVTYMHVCIHISIHAIIITVWYVLLRLGSIYCPCFHCMCDNHCLNIPTEIPKPERLGIPVCSWSCVSLIYHPIVNHACRYVCIYVYMYMCDTCSVPAVWAFTVFFLQGLICKYFFFRDKNPGKFLSIRHQWVCNIYTYIAAAPCIYTNTIKGVCVQYIALSPGRSYIGF